MAKNRKQAIDEKCKSCAYSPELKGTWREQVEKCICVHCPLHAFRPVTIATTTKRKQEKFNAMTPEQQEVYALKQEVTKTRFTKT